MNEIVLPVTALYAGLLGLMSVFVANRVLYARLNAAKLREGQEQTNLRIQGNFVENAPLALVMLLTLELGQLPILWVHLFGASLFVFRFLHVWGMTKDPGATYPRLIGAQGTFLLMSVMGMMAVWLYVAPLVLG